MILSTAYLITFSVRRFVSPNTSSSFVTGQTNRDRPRSSALFAQEKHSVSTVCTLFQCANQQLTKFLLKRDKLVMLLLCSCGTTHKNLSSKLRTYCGVAVAAGVALGVGEGAAKLGVAAGDGEASGVAAGIGVGVAAAKAGVGVGVGCIFVSLLSVTFPSGPNITCIELFWSSFARVLRNRNYVLPALTPRICRPLCLHRNMRNPEHP